MKKKMFIGLLVSIMLFSSIFVSAGINDYLLSDNPNLERISAFEEFLESLGLLTVAAGIEGSREPGDKFRIAFDEFATKQCDDGRLNLKVIDPTGRVIQDGYIVKGPVKVGGTLRHNILFTVPSDAVAGIWKLESSIVCGLTGEIISSISSGEFQIGKLTQCTEGFLSDPICFKTTNEVFRIYRSCLSDTVEALENRVIKTCSGSETCDNGKCITKNPTNELESCVNAYGNNHICSSSQFCSSKNAEGYSNCCIDVCTSKDVEDKDGNGDEMPLARTQIGIKADDLGTASEDRLRKAACSSTKECFTGKCISLRTGDLLQTIFSARDLLTCETGNLFFDYLCKRTIRKSSEQSPEVIAEVILNEGKEGICTVDFTPIDKEDDTILNPDNKCAKPFSPKEPFEIPLIGITIKIPLLPRCSESFTKEDFKLATDAELFLASCNENRNCNPKEGFLVDCVKQEIAGVEIPASISEKIKGFIWATKEPGVCLARPPAPPENGNGNGFGKFFGDLGTSTKAAIIIGGVLVIIFIFANIIK